MCQHFGGFRIRPSLDRRPLILLCTALVFAAVATSAPALTWDGSGVSPGSPVDGSGTWSTSAANWSNFSADVPWTNGNDAIFGNGGSGAAMVSLSGSLATNSIAFNPGAQYSIDADNADQLSLGSGGITVAPNTTAALVGTSAASTTTYDIVLTASQTWNVGAGALLDSNARYTSTPTAVTLTKTGAGTLLFEGTNGGSHDIEGVTYDLDEGVILVQNSGAMGFSGNSLNIADGAALELNVTSFAFGNANSVIALAGTGINNTGAIRAIGGLPRTMGAGASGVPTFTLLSASTGIGVDPGTSLTFDEIFGGSGGLTKLGQGTLKLGDTDTYTGGTSVSAGTLVVANSGALGSAGLSIAAGATVQLASGLASAVAIPALAISGDSAAPTATLDLTNNALIVEATADTRDSVFASLQNQTLYGTTHATGILSSTLASGMAIAVVENAALGTPLTTFDGQSVDKYSILITPALLGDTDLSGTVDLNDLNVVLNHLGTAASAWNSGNFDGAPTIDLNDLNDVLNNLGASFPNSAFSTSSNSTPEPSSLLLISLAALPLLTKRRPVK